jgi:hypothetical protein
MLLSGIAAILLLAVFVYLAFVRRERNTVIDVILAMLLAAAWWIGKFSHLSTLWLPSGVWAG